MVTRISSHFSFLTALLLPCLLIAAYAARCSGAIPIDLEKAGHVLNRIAYGPSEADLSRVRQIGLQAYIAEQLDPAGIDERSNVRLKQKEDALFTLKFPAREVPLIMAGEFWRYRKGVSEPDSAWNQTAFDDIGWLRGPTGIGMGDGDDRTVLTDMRRINDDPETPEDEGRPGYLSVYLRRTFQLDAESLAAIGDLILRVDYDDGFRAYLNGVQVAMANLPGGRIVLYNTRATRSHEAGTPQDFDITGQKGLLRIGENVLAIQVHNRTITNGDLSMIPELLSREILPGPARRVIRGIDELQQLVHVRGVYSQRQLQAVLAEFWENHFTTDYDKLAEYLDGLQNSDATDAMSQAQARAEAAQIEYKEYQFFYDNALGNFEDLLLYSATSPSMLVYLDNVLNIKGAANENYAREILELFAFGVDNRYSQKDIEQLAECFTGWSVCKVPPDQAQSFPASALAPPVECEVEFEQTALINLGTGWKFFKGIKEPTPAANGEPTTAWAGPGFDDSTWLRGTTGIGYGDGDDATVLTDMRGNYLSVYMRRRFMAADPGQIENLILEIAYDDGFVAYLNGDEIARSGNMEGLGSPPAHDVDTNGNHEVTQGIEYISLKPYRSLLTPGENVLAIQVHNGTLNSSDLSIIPRLLHRRILPGNIENGDLNGIWTFRFDPDKYDTGGKTLFEGTLYRIAIPAGQGAGRGGLVGLGDTLDIVQSMANHPSTVEFICIKLIQKFVSDEITLATYKDGTAPAELTNLLADAIAAWNFTDPKGNIATVMQTILDPVNQSNIFWSQSAYRSKVKTPIEYINSSLRALDATAGGKGLPGLNDAMGMHLFTRDDPDGYSELGFDWIDTASMLERIDFVRELSRDSNAEYYWDAILFLDERNLETAAQIVDYFDELLFQNTLPEANRNLLLEYLATDANGEPRRLNRLNPQDFQRRTQEFAGLLLSMPQWNFQ
ncbi:MAG: hypothetical protein CEE38_05250 [Planctomycetes bacterium B3_Pla]|nr:MAG: hypothetical protein CEE38_05250 [Planctomycetes bacterium B3_Pla]